MKTQIKIQLEMCLGDDLHSGHAKIKSNCKKYTNENIDTN